MISLKSLTGFHKNHVVRMCIRFQVVYFKSHSVTNKTTYTKKKKKLLNQKFSKTKTKQNEKKNTTDLEEVSIFTNI